MDFLIDKRELRSNIFSCISYANYLMELVSIAVLQT